MVTATMNPYSPEAMAEALEAQIAKRDAILKVSAPLRATRDTLRNKILPMEAELRSQNEAIQEAEKDLYAVEMTISTLTKAIGGSRVRSMTAETDPEAAEE